LEGRGKRMGAMEDEGQAPTHQHLAHKRCVAPQ